METISSILIVSSIFICQPLVTYTEDHLATFGDIECVEFPLDEEEKSCLKSKITKF